VDNLERLFDYYARRFTPAPPYLGGTHVPYADKTKIGFSLKKARQTALISPTLSTVLFSRRHGEKPAYTGQFQPAGLHVRRIQPSGGFIHISTASTINY